MTVRDALGQWFETRKSRWTLKVADYVKHLTEGWKESFGAVRVAEVGVSEIETHETLRDNGKRSASALNQERTYLRMFFSWCKAHGRMQKEIDPTATWRYRRYEVKREYAPLTREEEERFVKLAPAWLGRFVTVAICTGLRAGTLRQLTWRMVSEEWVLEIPSRLIKQKRALRLPLPERARQALGARGGEGLLFPELPKAAALYKQFKKWAAVAGVNPTASIHDLRRTWVERLTEAGVPIQKIMIMGGWKSMGILLNHYCGTVRDQHALEALERV